MFAIQPLLRKWLVLWLLLAVPAQVLAAVLPCNAMQHADVAPLVMQHDCHSDHAGHTKQADHHPAADHAKCGGGCCMGWMAAASVVTSESASGTEKTVLLPPHFVGFISETPQRPPNQLSA